MSRGLGAPTPSPHADTVCRQGLLSSRRAASSISSGRRRTRSMSTNALRERRCSYCGRLFALCRACDRGHRYCSVFCRLQGQRAVRRRATKRYRASQEARDDHRDRERGRRANARAVGHQGSEIERVDDTMETPTAASPTTTSVETAQRAAQEHHAHLSLSRCAVCGRDSAWLQRQLPPRRFRARSPRPRARPPPASRHTR
jgi:hypothetical protein